MSELSFKSVLIINRLEREFSSLDNRGDGTPFIEGLAKLVHQMSVLLAEASETDIALQKEFVHQVENIVEKIAKKRGIV